MSVSRPWLLGGNPKGIVAQSPRLPYSATLGHRVHRATNPYGGAARTGGCDFFRYYPLDVTLAHRKPTGEDELSAGVDFRDRL